MLGLGSPISSDTTKGNLYKNGYCLAFDGTNDSVDLASGSLMTALASYPFHGTGTISLWFQMTDAVSSNGMLFDLTGDDDNRIYIQYKQSNDTISCVYKGQGNTKTCSLDPADSATLEGDDKWHHIAFTWSESGSAVAYFDSTNATNSKTLGSTFRWAEGVDASADGAALKIGESSAGTPDYQGYIDNITLYSDQKTADQVAEIYNDGTPQIPTLQNQICHWAFEEGSTTTTWGTGTEGEDLTYSGTISGAAFVALQSVNFSVDET